MDRRLTRARAPRPSGLKVPILLDTNLIVALWMDDPRLGWLEQALRQRTGPWATADALLAEARDVLARPAIQRVRSADAAAIDAWLLERFGGVALRTVSPDAPVAPRAPDPGDQFLWDLLHAHADLVLWTRDRRLLESPGMRGRVLTPDAQGLGSSLV